MSPIPPFTPPGGGADAFSGATLEVTTPFHIANGASTAVEFDTVVIDTDGYYDSDNPTRLTAPEAAAYEISAQITIGSASVAGVAYLYFYVNGDGGGRGPFGGTWVNWDPAEGAGAESLIPLVFPARAAELEAGDYVEANVVFFNEVGGMDVQYDTTFFQIKKL